MKERSMHSSNLAGIYSFESSATCYELRICRIADTSTANKESMPAGTASRKKECVELTAAASTHGHQMGPANTQDT